MNDPALHRLRQALNDIVRGKPEVVDLALIAALARGHILLEDVPGVGKTTLAQALARGLGCSFKRVQFTSDLLPGDILGVNIFVQQRGVFEFKPGPIFANVVLADEINRTTPKTQSSLLEAMNEGQVSLDDQTRALPQPFIVVATQNPQEYHGTYPLPESQMDRFMVRLRMGYPAASIEKQILQGRGGTTPVSEMAPVLDPEQLLALQRQVDAVRVDELVLDYLLQVVQATRRAPTVLLGASTRGALALQQACRARAFLEGRRFVLPDDVKALARAVLAHRLVMAGEMDPLLRGRDEAERAIGEILEQLPVPV
jgi:MoxR-like ATPase